MYALLSDQGTACSETALCNECYKDSENRAYAFEQAASSDDIPHPWDFVDCSGNDALDCCICGKSTGEEVSE